MPHVFEKWRHFEGNFKMGNTPTHLSSMSSVGNFAIIIRKLTLTSVQRDVINNFHM